MYYLSGRILVVLFLLTQILIGAPSAARTAELRVRLGRITLTPTSPPWVSVLVSVARASGQAVKGLEAGHFRVSQDGQPIFGPLEVETFVATDRELGYVLLLDHREDIPTSLTLVRRAGEAFISDMGFRYQGAVLSYADHPLVVAGPFRNPGRLAAAVLALEPVAGTPRLYDGLLLGVQTLTQLGLELPAGLDRRVIVLLTEGLDRNSVFSPAAAASRVLETGVSLFVIGYGAEDSPALRHLADLAGRSGGDYFFAPDPDGLRTCLMKTADLMKEQYVLGYPAKQLRRGGSHRLVVEVRWLGLSGKSELEFESPVQARSWPVPLAAGLGLGLVLALSVWLGSRRRRGKSFKSLPG